MSECWYVSFHRMRRRELHSRFLGLPSAFSSYDIWLAWQPQVCGGISNAYTLELRFCCCSSHLYDYNCPGSFYFATHVHLKRFYPWVCRLAFCLRAHTGICFDLFPFECICGSVMQYFNLKFAFHFEWKATLLGRTAAGHKDQSSKELLAIAMCALECTFAENSYAYIFSGHTHTHTWVRRFSLQFSAFKLTL